MTFIEPNESLLNRWRANCHAILEKRYHILKRKHEEAVTKANAEFNKQLNAANSENRETENEKFRSLSMIDSEFRRLCVELLLGPFSNLKQARELYIDWVGDFSPESDAYPVPKVTKNADLDKHAKLASFVENTMDWPNYAYELFPYYWKKEWRPDQEETVLTKFLQSGMAKVVVPVALGAESSVLYFLETGDIWNGGGMVIEDEDQTSSSINLDLQEIEGKVEDEWQTRVPTAMKIIFDPDEPTLTQGRLSPANLSDPLVQAIESQYDVIKHSTVIDIDEDGNDDDE